MYLRTWMHYSLWPWAVQALIIRAHRTLRLIPLWLCIVTKSNMGQPSFISWISWALFPVLKRELISIKCKIIVIMITMKFIFRSKLPKTMNFIKLKECLVHLVNGYMVPIIWSVWSPLSIFKNLTRCKKYSWLKFNDNHANYSTREKHILTNLISLHSSNTKWALFAFCNL